MIYDYLGNALSAVWDWQGNRLNQAYDYLGNPLISGGGNVNPDDIVPDVAPLDYNQAMADIRRWLIQDATYTANGETYVKERYRMDTGAWASGATAMACAQAAYTYCLLWRYYGTASYLTTARNLCTSLEKGRDASGGFPMFIYGGSDRNIYTGGNSEVPISLFRIAELDTENAETYRTRALLSTDYLLSIQNADGSWRTVTNDSTPTALFTAQAVAAISMGYAYTSRKAEYRTAVEKGIAYIGTQVLSGNRIKSCREANPGTEYWRPPTSDQSIVIRGIAIAELCLSDDSNAATWRTLRQNLHQYLDQCIGTEGAVRNGLETTNLPNDFYGLTDHVYTTSFAIEAYYFSAVADASSSKKGISVGIVNFCSGNLYYSTNSALNGVLRGAYNIADDNWDTSALTQDSGNEGGAEMVYVGWVNAPVLAWMVRYQMEAESMNQEEASP